MAEHSKYTLRDYLNLIPENKIVTTVGVVCTTIITGLAFWGAYDLTHKMIEKHQRKQNPFYSYNMNLDQDFNGDKIPERLRRHGDHNEVTFSLKKGERYVLKDNNLELKDWHVWLPGEEYNKVCEEHGQKKVDYKKYNQMFEIKPVTNQDLSRRRR